MGHRDSIYQLSNSIEMDDALVGGKRDRGAQGKTPVMVACENGGEHTGFMAMKAVEPIDKETVNDFSCCHLQQDQYVATDAYPS